MLAEPAWLNRIPREMHERVYVGGRVEGFVNVFDIDAPKYASFPDERFTQLQQRHLIVGAARLQPVRRAPA